MTKNLTLDFESIRTEAQSCLKSEAEERAKSAKLLDGGEWPDQEWDELDALSETFNDEKPVSSILACFKEVSAIVGPGDAYKMFKSLVGQLGHDKRFVKKYLKGPGRPAKMEWREFTDEEKLQLAMLDIWIERGGNLFGLAQAYADCASTQDKHDYPWLRATGAARKHLKRLQDERGKQVASGTSISDWMARQPRHND